MLQLGFLLLAWGLAPGFAFADQTEGRVTITDLEESPITATVTGGTNQVNETVTADMATPEKLSFTISVDGTVAGGTGVDVLLEDGKIISDVLEVTVTPKTRGMNIPFFDTSGTFTSDGDDPKGIDPATLGLAQEVLSKVLASGLVEDGTQQDIGSRLINTATGEPLNIGGLVITAALEVPVPSNVLLFGPGLLGLVMLSWRRRGLRNWCGRK